MVVSYVEEIVSEYYRLKGYFISKDWKYRVPKEVTGKKVSGWKDIDVLAITDKEVLIIECKAFTGYRSSRETTKKLSEDFKQAERAIKNARLVGNKSIKKILVVDSSIKKVERNLKKRGIEVYLLEELMRNFLKLLRKVTTMQEHPMTRTLKYLVEHEFIQKSMS